MLDLLERFKEIVRAYRVVSYEQEGNSYRIKVEINLIDDSQLFMKEYLFENAERKYAFHWSDRQGNLLCRWDDSPHWPNLRTFPHHKHVGTNVLDSRETTLEEVLLRIAEELKGRK
ncbi:MAG: DUF6516 family protein [Thermodesulfobacteriota bacterium]